MLKLISTKIGTDIEMASKLRQILIST